MEDYIVYEVLYLNKCVYIGSGSLSKKRHEHAKSGKSHNPDLNRLYFTDPDNMVVNIIREGLTKQESLEMEKEYIQATEPIYNKALTSRTRKVHKHRRFLDNWGLYNGWCKRL